MQIPIVVALELSLGDGCLALSFLLIACPHVNAYFPPLPSLRMPPSVA